MYLLASFEAAVIARAVRDPEFASALLAEAAGLHACGEHEIATRLIELVKSRSIHYLECMNFQ